MNHRNLGWYYLMKKNNLKVKWFLSIVLLLSSITSQAATALNPGVCAAKAVQEYLDSIGVKTSNISLTLRNNFWDFVEFKAHAWSFSSWNELKSEGIYEEVLADISGYVYDSKNKKILVTGTTRVDITNTYDRIHNTYLKSDCTVHQKTGTSKGRAIVDWANWGADDSGYWRPFYEIELESQESGNLIVKLGENKLN